MTKDRFVLVGGSGFLGTAVARDLLAAGAAVTSLDPQPPAEPAASAGLDGAGLDWAGLDGAGLDGAGLDGAGLDEAGLDWVGADVLTDELAELPPGTVVLLHGASDPRPRRPRGD